MKLNWFVRANQDKEHPKLVVIGTAPTIVVCASQSLYLYFFKALIFLYLLSFI